MEIEDIDENEEIKPVRKYDCKYYEMCLEYHAFLDIEEIVFCNACKRYLSDNQWREDDPLAICKLLLEVFKEEM